MSSQPQDLKLNEISFNQPLEESQKKASSSSPVLSVQPLFLSPTAHSNLQHQKPIDWNWVHVNRKFNHPSADEGDLEIVSNLGDSFCDTREIENDLTDTANVGSESSPAPASTTTSKTLSGFNSLAGTGGIFGRKTTPPKFPADFHQHQPFSAFKRVAQLDSSPRLSLSAVDDTIEPGAEEKHIAGENSSLSNSISSVSWKFLDGSVSSAASHHSPDSPSRRSEISHHTCTLEDENHQSLTPLSLKDSSWSNNSVKTGDLVDDVLDSLVLPSPVITAALSINQKNKHSSSSFSDDDFEDIPTPRTEEFENKIPAGATPEKPSNLDILNAYIAQFQLLANSMDVDALVELVKSSAVGKGSSDPWYMMRIVGILLLATYGGYYFFKASVSFIRSSSFSEFLSACHLRGLLYSR